jgi:WD40 repeat protein
MGVMGARRWVVTVLMFVLAPVGGALAWAAPAGAVVSQFGSQGEGAGQFETPRGVAVDQASGDVYLMDFGNVRIDKFSGEGPFLLAWGWGVADGTTLGLQTCTTTCYKGPPGLNYGPGTGEFGLGVSGVSVDNDPLSVSYEDVYVPDPGNNRVEKFDSSGDFLGMFGKEVNEDGANLCVAGEKCQPGKEGNGAGEFDDITGAIAVGSNGDVYVGGSERVQVFGPEGVFVEQFAVGGGETRSIAVDGTGDFYVVNEEPAVGVREYDSSGSLLHTLDGEGKPQAVTLDPSGDLFVDDGLGGHRLLEYAPSGEQLASFDTGTQDLDAGKGIAFGDTIDRLYVVNQKIVRLVSVPPPGPELIGSELASGIEPLTVTVNATINPEGNATTYRFEYGPTTTYGSSAPAPEGSLAASFNQEPVAVTLTKLTAGTTYHYRVVATDSKGRVATGPDQTFTTQAAVLIDSVSVTNVAATSATFEAQLNPLGVDAEYRIEYDTSEYAPEDPAHGTSVSEGSLGTGSSDVSVGAHVAGLQPGTLYHYRAVAHDTREGVAYTLYSQDRTFTTQAVGSGLALPDGRRWEMVSPPDKLGTQILAIGQYSGEGAVIEAAAGGNAMTYMTTSPTEAEPLGYMNYLQVLSARGAGGWGSRDIALPHSSAPGPSIGDGEEYRFFSEDLSLGLIQPFGQFDPSLSGEASEQTPYFHTDFLDGNVDSRCVNFCYRPLVTGMPGHENVPAGTAFGNEGECPGAGPAARLICGPEFIGATTDLKHVVLRSIVALTSTPVEGARESLYEWSDGALALIDVLPGGHVANSFVLGSLGNARHAISDDGSRVVWSEPASEHLYMRGRAGNVDKTVQLDAVEGGSAQESAGAVFQIASSDGSRVFFTDTQRLTGDARDGHERGLYECEMVEEAGNLKCKLTDLTPSSSGEFAGVQGVVGASSDGSWVYFVAGSTLYVHHGGTTKPVAVLSAADGPDWRFQHLPGMTARVSSDGRWLAFMSRRDLTGYDTHDAVTREPDEEVYLYDAEADGGAGMVACASCNPTGAQPVGATDPGDGLTLGESVWNNSQRVAANIPGWTPYTLGESLYQSRYLSDSGRLFFNSSDALVPQDVNGTEDVYQYERPGVGDCTSASASFVVSSDGCVSLISSGGSAEESGFMDASATGGDVFFVTNARLSGMDRDTAVDIYDAHECTTVSPCFAVPPAQSPVCDTGDSCKAAPSPQPTVFGAPSSATFSGAGNVASSTGRSVVRSKSLTRAQKLARALRECRKRKGRRRRAACVRHARARFARSESLRVTASGRVGR